MYCLKASSSRSFCEESDSGLACWTSTTDGALDARDERTDRERKAFRRLCERKSGAR